MIPVKITNGRYKVKQFERELERKYGLQYDEGNECSTGTILSSWTANGLQMYCEKHKLKYEINNLFGKRSMSYRGEFFSHNKPAFGEKFFCSYCGKILSHRSLVVDHLYPVDKVNKSIHLQYKLRNKGADSVNHYINLVPSCMVCNAKKGAKMGFWIVRGQIGRHANVWKVIWSFRIFITISLLYAAYINWNSIVLGFESLKTLLIF